MIDDDLRALTAFIRESASSTYDYARELSRAAPFEPIPRGRGAVAAQVEYLANCSFRLFNVAEKIERGIKINQTDYDLAAVCMEPNNREFLPILRRCLK